MMLSPCSRENEVAELLRRGQWPAACPAELRAHLSACRACRDLVLVTETFLRARTQAAKAARIATPGALWWRAQLRRRNAAVERLGKPVLGAQIFALAINLFIVVAFLAYQARNGLSWLSRLEQLPQAYSLHLGNLSQSALLNPGWSLMVLIPAAATLALLGGVVVYLASEKQ
jgi:predicted anti-sigma-YlaC factor YlaD